jgi:hypothetical protein
MLRKPFVLVFFRLRARARHHECLSRMALKNFVLIYSFWGVYIINIFVIPLFLREFTGNPRQQYFERAFKMNNQARLTHP